MNPKTAPTPEQIAKKKIDTEIARRTSNSIFDARGDLRHDASSFASDGQIHLGEYMHLNGIDWPSDPNYGSEHCIWLSRLTKYIAELPDDKVFGGIPGGPLSVMEQNVLQAVAMLYCTGMKDGIIGYEARSAAVAEHFFRDGGGVNTVWAKPEIREDVCRLIYKHNDEREVAQDKRLQVFSDALRYENARFAPNTPQGMSILKERIKPELFFTGWAKNRDNFRSWMITRGWK